MNPLSEFLEELANRDIRVWTDSGSLRCSCPSHLMTPELRADLAAHKSELLRFLERPSPPIDRDFDSENAWMGAELTSGTGIVSLTEPCFREIDSLRSELRERPGHKSRRERLDSDFQQRGLGLLYGCLHSCPAAFVYCSAAFLASPRTRPIIRARSLTEIAPRASSILKQWEHFIVRS